MTYDYGIPLHISDSQKHLQNSCKIGKDSYKEGSYKKEGSRKEALSKNGKNSLVLSGSLNLFWEF
jgi:hypothetical protein